jgi:hypothetical protein
MTMDQRLCPSCGDLFNPPNRSADLCENCSAFEQQEKRNAMGIGRTKQVSTPDDDIEELMEALQRAHRRWPTASATKLIIEAVEFCYASDGDDEPDIYEVASLSTAQTCEMVKRYIHDAP